MRRRRLAEGLAGARGSSLAGPTVVLGPGPYPEWANTYDGLHMYRPGERAGWRRREDPGGLEMRVASAARPVLEAGVDFGRAWRSAGRGSDQLIPSRSAPATAWVEAANDFFYLQLQLSSHDASVDNSLDVAEEDEPDGELFEDELHEDLYKEDDLDEEEPDEELYEAYEIEEELLLEE
ncbi:unnamed protein product [Miscanthus lutarioriparius]|uniref:Uncharacterized protein n=1 Tax=Miscanthus lutarioriparius TaxID=422564 RepID=A0A811SDF6_9POAL|nr:unnamed protein product [Miscanthus lutarioriparius]